MRRFLCLVTLVCICVGGVSAQVDSAMTWYITTATWKITPDSTSFSAPLSSLHAARGEYAPFQIVLEGQGSVQVQVEIASEVATVSLYQEQVLPLPTFGEPEFYAQARLWTASALPDALSPLPSPLRLTDSAVIWADLQVLPDAPPGTYPVTVRVNDQAITLELVIYALNLPPTAGVSAIIPLDVAWTVTHYAPLMGMTPVEYHQKINQTLLAHGLIPGAFVATPQLTSTGWNFSALDAELAALPLGAQFLAPAPYDDRFGGFLLPVPSGGVYQESDFDDPAFREALNSYLVALQGYLASRDRLNEAWLYPTDERRWVADEPIHAGMAGFEHLARWTEAIRAAGLHVVASGVTPAAAGDVNLGWLPGAAVADNFHVHTDQFDANPAHFEGTTTSLYLNEYGDLVDMSAAIQRGFIWHAYGRAVRMLMGYEALEWATEDYDLVLDPLNDPSLAPVSGYGGGALIYPDGSPSLRLKWLREGLEDSRLLDLYAELFGTSAAQSLARCWTPGRLADQNPTPEYWDAAHSDLLQSLEQGISSAHQTCQESLTVAESQPFIPLAQTSPADWDAESASLSIEADRLLVTFGEGLPSVGYWLGERNLQGWQALQMTVTAHDPYFSRLDVGLVDAEGNYLLLRNSAIWLAPTHTTTLTLPFVTPPNEAFDWSRVTYLTLEANTETEQTNHLGETAIFPLGSRRMTFEAFLLVR